MCGFRAAARYTAAEMQTLERAPRALSLDFPRRRAHLLAPLAAVLSLAALFIYFAVSPQPEFARDPFGDALRHHLIIGFALGAWLIALLVRQRLPRPTPLDLALGLLVLAQLAAVLAMQDRRLGLEPTLNVISIVLLFYVLVDAPGLSAAALQSGLLLMAGGAAILAMHSVWLQWNRWLDLVRSVFGSVGGSFLPPTVPRVSNVGSHVNVLAALLTLTIPLFVLRLVRTRGPLRWLYAAGLLLVEAAIFFTLSRSAWAGQIVALGVCGGGLACADRRYHLPRGPLAGAGAGAAVLAIVAVLVLVSGERPIWLFRPSLAPRADMRAVGLRIFEGHPLTGAGPGSYPLLYPSEHGAYPETAIHSHNVIVQIAADTGLLGLLAAAFLSFCAARFLWRLWRDGDRGQRALAACVAASFAAFAVDGMGDSLHLFPEVLLVLAALMALALRSARERPCTSALAAFWPRRWRFSVWPAPALTACLLIVAVPLAALWVGLDEAGYHYARSVDLAGASRWLDAAHEADRAIALDPTMALYHVQSGVAWAQTEQVDGLQGGRERGIQELSRSLALDPRSAPTRLDLAALLAEEGEPDQALAQMPLLLRDANRDSLILLGDAVLVEQLRPDDAVETYAGLLVLNPTLADTPFWQETAFRREHFNDIVERALYRVGEVATGSSAQSLRDAIELYAGLPEALSHVPSGDDFASRVARGRLLTDSGSYDRALPLLRGAVAEQPDDPSARLALGDVDAALGDLEAARQQWVAGAYLGDAASLSRLGDSFAPEAVPGRIMALEAQAITNIGLSRFYLTFQHYRFTYQRHEPLPILLQGDWLNALPNEYYQMQAGLQRWQESASGPGEAR